MALPNRTPEQLQEALGKALEHRRRRATLMGRIKRGEVTLAQLFWMASNGDEVAGATKVLTAVAAFPGISRKRALVFLQDAHVAENRRIRGTGSRQRADLVQLVDAR